MQANMHTTNIRQCKLSRHNELFTASEACMTIKNQYVSFIRE